MYNRSVSMPTGSQDLSSASENQSEFGSQSRSFGQSSQPGPRPRGFGSPEELVTRPKGFGAPPQRQNVTNSFGKSDLDRKCDVSVRSNGLAKVFMETGKVLEAGFSGQKFKTSDPTHPRDLMSKFSREGSSSMDDELFCNRQLPEQCPWWKKKSLSVWHFGKICVIYWLWSNEFSKSTQSKNVQLLGIKMFSLIHVLVIHCEG